MSIKQWKKVVTFPLITKKKSKYRKNIFVKKPEQDNIFLREYYSPLIHHKIHVFYAI